VAEVLVTPYRFDPHTVVQCIPVSGNELRPTGVVIDQETVGADGRLHFTGAAEWGLFDWGDSFWSAPGTTLVDNQRYWLVGRFDGDALTVRVRAHQVADPVQTPVIGSPWPHIRGRYGRL
jgi:hypothetical protein